MTLTINGVQVFEDHNALAVTAERTFPTSIHRSARIRKKLIKRFGGEYKKAPAIFQVQGRIYAHPLRYAELRRGFSPRTDPRNDGVSTSDPTR